MIGRGQVEAQHPEDRPQKALRLTKGQVEDEPERQRGFDGNLGVLQLPSALADAHGLPRGDRFRRQPQGDVASLDQCSVVRRPVSDAVFRFVPGMHSRLHVEIMPLRPSRWPGPRRTLVSAHQRRALRVVARIVEVATGDIRRTVTLDGMADELFMLQDRIVVELSAGFDLLVESNDQPRAAVFAQPRPPGGPPSLAASPPGGRTTALAPTLVGGTAGSAQAGSVRGSVVDRTGLVLPGVIVTLRGDGIPRTVASDERGDFELAGLAPDTYMLTVSLPGFSDATVDGVVVSDGALELPPVVLQLASFGDTVVVTASRNEVRLIDAPVSTSVISTATLETTSAQNYGDLLRATPGVNVIQLSARDVQVTSRSPGNTLNELAARPGGRSQRLPRLLRPRPVGSAPDQLR